MSVGVHVYLEMLVNSSGLSFCAQNTNQTFSRDYRFNSSFQPFIYSITHCVYLCVRFPRHVNNDVVSLQVYVCIQREGEKKNSRIKSKWKKTVQVKNRTEKKNLSRNVR